MTDQDTMKEIIRRIVQVAKPDRIVLFGSAARGEVNDALSEGIEI
jgi:predicted nucleotidyltransferase